MTVIRILFLLVAASKPDDADGLKSVFFPFPIEKSTYLRLKETEGANLVGELQELFLLPHTSEISAGQGQCMAQEWPLGS